ncbi:MAG: AGE family epimerase/isomerase [Candidatus Latescibacterota bacterium]
MNRRPFLKTSAGTALALAASPRVNAQSKRNAPAVDSDGLLAGLTLQELRDRYRSFLYDEFLPFMDKYVIDAELGGFMCGVDRDGRRLHTDKDSWFTGRGIWTYSYLYNNVEKNEHFRETARKAVEFVLKTKPSGDVMWPRGMTRTGEAKAKPDDQVYGDMFIAQGLAEFAKASGDAQYRAIAKEIMRKCIRVYDRPDYQPGIGRTYLGADAPEFPGARIVGVWMVLILFATQVLEQERDPEITAVADRCIDALVNYHYNPEFGLMNELINHDLSRPANDYAQLSYTSHAWETLWMVMAEAMRRKDKKLFDLAAERFRRHIECSWDDVYGGAFSGCRNVNENTWILNKAMWPQEETLIGTMMVMEHTGAAWARELYSKTFAYVTEKFHLKRHGYAMFSRSADRKGVYDIHHYNSVDLFHNPRHLMMNLMALERMIKRSGKISGFWG